MKRFLFLFVLFAAFACSEEGVRNQTDYDFSSSNILSFKDGTEISAYLRQPANNLTTKFISMESRYREALNKIDGAETSVELESILKKYADVVILKNETYEPVFTNSSYRKIINKDRLYLSGGFVHKVVDDRYIVFTDKKYVNDLLKVESIENLDSRFTIARYQSTSQEASNGRTMANCGDELSADYFDNHTKCKDDRRAWVHGHAFYMMSGSQYTPWALCEVYGQKRSGTFCNWNSYGTVLYYKNCSFTLKFAINGTTLYYPYPHSSLPDYSGTGDEVSHEIFYGPVGTAVTWGGGTPPAAQFDAIHLEGSTQGVGANDPTHWAVINCQ